MLAYYMKILVVQPGVLCSGAPLDHDLLPVGIQPSNFYLQITDLLFVIVQVIRHAVCLIGTTTVLQVPISLNRARGLLH